MAHVAEVNALKPPSDEYDDEEVSYEGDEEESLRLHNTFPTFVYSGTLIVAFSIFETHLTDLRKSLTKEFSLTVVDNPNQSPTFQAQSSCQHIFRSSLKPTRLEPHFGFSAGQKLFRPLEWECLTSLCGETAVA